MPSPGNISMWRSPPAGIKMRASLLITAIAATVIGRAAENGYVDAALCRPCHAAIYESYSRTGMARTFSRALGVPSLGGVLHAPSRPVSPTVPWAAGGDLPRTGTRGGNLLRRRSG